MVATTPVSSILRHENTFTLLGDSRLAAYYLDVAKRNRSNATPIGWANAFSDQRMQITGNFAASGERTDQILARLSSAIATAGNIIIWAGVNDLSQGVTDAVAFANIKTMIDTALLYGVRPWVFTEPGATNLNATAIERRNDLNQRLREYAEKTPRMVLFDAADAALAKDTTGLTFKTGYAADHVHLGAVGSRYVGEAFGALVRSIVPPLPQSPCDQSQISGTSARLVNPMMTGTTAAAAGMTGSVPTGFTSLRNGTTTAAFSLAADAAGYGQEVTMAATFAADNESVRLRQNLSITGLSAGDILQGGVIISVASGATNLRSVTLQIDVTVDAVQTINHDFLGDAQYLNDSGGYTNLYLKTDPLVIPTGTLTAASWNVRAYSNGAGAAEVKIRRPWMRRRFAA